MTATPRKTGELTWGEIVALHARRRLRPGKDGTLLGGYKLNGKRANDNVQFRTLIQLDIDTQGEKDKVTDRVLTIEKIAPPLDQIRAGIEAYEWVAASSHWHEPQRGVIKYRITALPDRAVQREEYEPLLEALNELLGGALDRGAFAWSQAFYLPSCPAENERYAFFERNEGAPLPVDALVRRGLEIIATKATPAGNVATGPRPIPEPETPEAVARVKSMLDAIDPDVDRETWRQACWGVLATGWDCAEKLIREWSERGEKFVETDFAKVVASFDPMRGTGVGSLVYIARQHGWQDPVNQATAKGWRDIANGQRFAKRFHDKLLYLADCESWLSFDPEIGWRPAPFGEADRAAKSIVGEIQAEARTKKQMTEVDRASLLRGLRAMIETAKSEPGMSARLSDFDNEAMVIGLQNCILDLDKWKCETPAPERKVLKRANVVYDPGAKCPQFRKFLKEVQPDPEVRRFLRAWAGYCLTGRTDEHVFFYFQGDGRNGKTTFIELIAWVLGDYAHKIPTEMLMTQQRNPQGPSPDIMLLKGVRFAWANETEEGKRLDEARIKDLTGGDTLSGRAPYAKTFIQFQPTHKLMIVGNYRAEVRDNSTGMWDRMILAPFEVTIPKADRDRRLGDTLKEEGAGILNWMLAGLWDYKTNGLTVPPAIRAATAAYRTEQDLIGEWIADNCVTGAGLYEEKRSLYFDYANWARTSGYIPVAQKRLTRQLGDRGYQRDSGKRLILGIAPKNSIMGRVHSMTGGSVTASGGGPVASRKIVEFKRRQAAPRGPVPDGGGWLVLPETRAARA
jgi:putative DNA primase/helicase